MIKSKIEDGVLPLREGILIISQRICLPCLSVLPVIQSKKINSNTVPTQFEEDGVRALREGILIVPQRICLPSLWILTLLILPQI